MRIRTVPGVTRVSTAVSVRSRRLRWRASYLWWRVAGRGPFSARYVEQIEDRLDSGEDHGTLSVHFSDPEAARVISDFVIETLQSVGLERSSFCIDYGCGALRIGERLMPLLEPGRYFGVDVTDTFWKNGLERLGSEFVERHRPRLELIPDDPADLARCDPDFLICIAVFIHVPPPELDAFIGRLAGSMTRHTTLLLDARLDDGPKHVHNRTWRHDKDHTLASLRRHGLDVAAAEPITRPPLVEELWVIRRPDFTRSPDRRSPADSA